MVSHVRQGHLNIARTNAQIVEFHHVENIFSIASTHHNINLRLVDESVLCGRENLTFQKKFLQLLSIWW